MTSRRAGGEQWRQTTVLIRSDIFTRALEEGIDISKTCNQALGNLLGIDYHQQKIPHMPDVRPVIVAKDAAADRGPAGPSEAGRSMRPVLNAEDPATPARLLHMRTAPAQKVKHGPVATMETERRSSPPAPEGVHHGSGQSPPPGKGEERKNSARKGREDGIRQFLKRKILRVEEPGEGEINRIEKDEMYRLFTRFCRTKNSSAVPDRKSFSAALKTRYVIDDVTIDGIHYWNNVKLR